jgi:pilus assembly protein CpaB
MRTRLALLAAVVLGIVAAIGVRSYIKEVDRKSVEGRKLVGILVARETLKRGDEVRDSLVREQQVDQAAVTGMHILYDQRRGYIGQRVTRQVPTGEAILKEDFITISEEPSIDRQRIRPGWRAITLGADQISGVAGLIRPGSRVDIIGTFRERGVGPEAAAAEETLLLAANVEVLAIDNRSEMRVPVRPGRRSPFEQGYSSITLHVLPIEASILAYAQTAGKLVFILRNADETTAAGADFKDPVTKPLFKALLDDAQRKRMEKLKEVLPARTGLE